MFLKPYIDANQRSLNKREKTTSCLTPHPEQSDGAPTIQTMSRNARHGVLRWSGLQKTAHIDKKNELEQEDSDLQKKAASTIQIMWRKSKIKQAMAKNPYTTYLSLRYADDEEQFLSASMFGRHVAEHCSTSKYRINNPYICEGADYHRYNGFSGELLEKLMPEFDIDSVKKEGFHTIIPIICLKNSPVLEVCHHFFKNNQFRLLENQARTVCFIALPGSLHDNKDNFYILTASGLIASPWEIATNIQHKDTINFLSKQITLNNHLPGTRNALVESTIYAKLSLLAQSNRPTKKLATCLHSILKNLPKNMHPKAIQSIACITDIANTFYDYDYPKYAFAVYAAIHEVSLALLHQTAADLNQSFDAFFTESRHTFDKAFAIKSANLNKTVFIACPAASGTNAYFLAMKLALKMKTTLGALPLVHVIKPSYYEFARITQTTNSKNADIFVLSTGPILNPEGLTPGVDINKFIKSYIIATKRTKPTTLIIDATTALYKNMHLDAEAKALICAGKLSIIVNESHQKFGMIHTDQAQYGRIFAICSKEQFDIDWIAEMQENAKKDYATHLDFRIGAYINSTCGDILEEIKEQHFSNGALLRAILIQTSLASKYIVKHPTMLLNLDELYFVVSSTRMLNIIPERMIEIRDSFGHFNTVLESVVTQVRFSPDASDNLDCLIQAAQIYMAYHIKPKDTLPLLIDYAKQTSNFSTSEQIISIALANYVFDSLSSTTLSDVLSLCFISEDLLSLCHELKGRQHYNWIAQSHFKLRQNIIDTYQTTYPKEFFQASRSLNDKGFSFKPCHLYSLANKPWVSPFILKNHGKLSIYCCYIVLEWATESQAQRLVENKHFCDYAEEMYLTINELKTNSNQHQHTKKYLELYFTDCLKELDVFYTKTQENQENKKTFIESISQARERYRQNIRDSDNSESFSIVKYTSKYMSTIVERISIAPYSFFYSHTTDENKLDYFHQKILGIVDMYGLQNNDDHTAFDETSFININQPTDFLSETGIQWQESLKPAVDLDLQVTTLRF